MRLDEALTGLGKAVTLFPRVAKWIGREESLFLSQMLYWRREDVDWTWKTSARIEEETSLSPREQRRVRKKLVELGILKEKEVPAEHRMYFQVDVQTMNKLWAAHLEGDGAQPDPLRTATRPLAHRNPLTTEKKPQITKEDKEISAARSGFFSELSFEQKCAKKLQEVIQGEFNIHKDTRSWITVFANMQRFDQISKERLRKVLVWYKHGISLMWVSKVEDAQTFRRKFGTIEKKMLEETPAPKPKAELSPDAKEALEELYHSHWPKGSRAQLPDVVQRSLVAYKAWRVKRDRFAAQFEMIEDNHYLNYKGPKALERFARFDYVLQTSIIRQPKTFVLAWFSRIHKQYATWTDWSGDLSNLAFTADHVRFTKWGHEQAASYGDSELWDKYVEKLNEN